MSISSAEAFVLDPEKDQPSPEEFLNGVPVYGANDSTLTIRSTSGASLHAGESTVVKLDQAPITFTDDTGVVREGYAIGHYSGARNLIFILLLS